MEVNQVISGFKVIKETELKDINSILYEMEHLKSGAKLCFVKNEDSNKTFSITFKTLPSDNTGVFHILEHCVLNGSKKYPVKEPFVELLKGSMQTFLNAFTSSDKTMYPLSSRNDKDFMNLISVYLDAVFNPLIYENPNIFYQEGWHYELEGDELSYNGVVFNEMKGAYSSIDDTLINKVNETLFPNSTYQYDSGGNPEYITDLTYEKFIETHKKYYHPSNSKIILDGDIKNIEEVLAFIDEEYLSKYGKQDLDINITFQEEVDAVTIEQEYELSKDESKDNRTVVGITKVVSTYEDVVKNMAWHLICEYLVSNNESKFSKAIIEKGLAEDVEFDLMEGLMQPWAILVLRNTEKENVEEAKRILQEVTKEVIEEGFDKKKLLSSINRLEFKIKENKELAGLINSQNIMRSWLYDGDPALKLRYSENIKELKEKMNEGYFEELLKEFIFSDKLCTVILKPSHELAEQRLEKENNKLERKKKEIDLEETKRIYEDFKVYQATFDTEENLATLPSLTIKDINEEPEDYPWKEERISGVDILRYPSDTSGISYINMYFNLAGITKEHLKELGLYINLLMRLDTESYDVEALQSEINTYIGSLKFNSDAYSELGENESCYPVLTVNMSVLNENIDKAIELVFEVIKNTKFEKDKVLQLLKQDNEEARQAMIGSGHIFAMNRVASHFRSVAAFKEYTSGYENIKYTLDLEKNYDELFESFVNECELFKEVIFSKDRLTLSTNMEGNESINKIIDNLSTVEANKAKVRYPLLKDKKEKYVIPGGVSYVSIGTSNNETEADAVLSVIQHALTYDYLWNEVRVKGGAYGTGINIINNGSLVTFSYRDPNPTNSIKAMQNCYEYLENLDENRDMTQMIIGTLAAAEPLSTTKNKILGGDSRYFKKITIEKRRENRKKIINTNAKELKTYASKFKEWMSDVYICVFGDEELLKDLEDYTDIREG